ncbi:squalene/phytoene synthase family protein [Polynucleobacter sp. IMCC 29146]|uniref:squalene/phytoene synthase family protein n=1 Tax=Polynucleobacter sp. IMCC 29146 TaxID=2780953 RepID=UPI001F3D280F|nr:squalene/phytoene synthase family protein [Polynucleobacter sp. IMCC 29146]MCE7528449.1 squalene/phytoene synthase family protein [Polynucleobacter sp. IMCC 29146]
MAIKNDPDLADLADLAYQKDTLNLVSRTFAITIPLLPPPLERAVGCAYLLCRIVDTIEDASCLAAPEKVVLSELFLAACLNQKPISEFMQSCSTALELHPNLAERDLIAHTATVVRILHCCPANQQTAILRCISIMSQGMTRFHAKQNPLGLKNLQEFEEYCYVVAGVVGEMLTSLFAAHSSQFAQAIAKQESLAMAFGQALQMTNILKDSLEDQARGVSWLPQNVTQAELLALAIQKLDAALTYILFIPKAEFGMRRFCLLALGLAVLTLDKLAASKKTKHQPQKISRRTVALFYHFTLIAARSNTLIKLFFYCAARPLKRVAIRP